MTRDRLKTNNYFFKKITAAFLLALAPLSEIISESARGAVYSYSQLDPASTKLISSKDLIAQADEPETASSSSTPSSTTVEEAGPIINFNNVSIIEFLRFVSRLTGRNFIFDPDELQFSVTIISETPATLDEVMAALLQNLRIHEFELIEQGTSFLIHRNKNIKSPTDLFNKDAIDGKPPQIATQVFLIEYVDAARVAAIIKSMASKDALVELIEESKRIVVTDLAANIRKIAELLTSLDSPKSGLEIGIYIAQNASPAALISTTTQLLEPFSKGQSLVLIPHSTANGVFIVASPFLVEKALSIMQRIDVGEAASGSFSFDQLKFDAKLANKTRNEIEQKLANEAKKGFSDEEIDGLSKDQVRAILRELGYSNAEIDKMTKDDVRRLLQQPTESLMQDQIRAVLKALGYSDAAIDKMSKEDMRRIMQQALDVENLSHDQLKSMLTPEQIRALLKSLGYTDSELNGMNQAQMLNKLTPEQIRKYFQASFDKLSQDQLRSMLTVDQMRSILKSLGYSENELGSMSTSQMMGKLTQEQIRRYFQTSLELGPTIASVKSEIRKKKVFETALPLGQVESTQFYIHKLENRKAAGVVDALHAIASTIAGGAAGSVQSDLITTLNTVQVIDESNSLILTGTTQTIQKAKELINQIDQPVRQVLIEVLVLDTTISNSLNFGVQWGGKVVRRNIAAEAVLTQTGSSNIITGLNSVNSVPAPPTSNPPKHASFPASTFDIVPSNVIGAPAAGFTAGSIGRKVLYNGHGFGAFAALIDALRTDDETHIIMNPKITTEHNVPAELFVGQTIGIKGQSVANDVGTIITTNFESVNTGILLQVTPLISAGDTVTMIIHQEVSSANAVQVAAQGNVNAPPATINATRTTTRVHVPTDHFLVLSGMIQDERDLNTERIPCLGSLPFVGAALFGHNRNGYTKRNLLLFLRPHIIDTTEDIDDITKKQQDIFETKSKIMAEQRGIIADMKEILNLSDR